MKYSLLTFGCRVNQADSIALEEELRVGGAVEAASPDEADLVVVNTCSVTATADQSARQAIRRVARQNPSVKIVVTGCYATRRADEVRAMPNVLRVVGNDDKPTLLEMVARDLALTTAERFGDGEGACGTAIVPGVAGRTAFTLRVQTGCDQPCSYCIIPTTRGRPRSVPLDDVLAEVDRAVSAGFKEIALTGVHLGSYGRDLTPRRSLVALLEELSAARSGALFRISSLEPMDCSSAVVDVIANARCFAPHFHLPLQHASERMLVAMCRPYTASSYAALVDAIRARLPQASIGSDVIVGFPGETDADFEQLATYLSSAPLTHVHVFPYSDRPGTAAAALGDRVPGDVVRARSAHIRHISAELTRVFRAGQVGTVHRGLTLEDGSLVVTGNYLKVRIPPGRARNEWVTVRIASADSQGIRGEVI